MRGWHARVWRFFNARPMLLDPRLDLWLVPLINTLLRHLRRNGAMASQPIIKVTMVHRHPQALSDECRHPRRCPTFRGKAKVGGTTLSYPVEHLPLL